MSGGEDSTRVVLGVTWASGEPQVRLRDGGAEASTLVSLVGLTLNYRADVDSPRCCLGKTPFRKADAAHTDCLNRPEPGGRLCRQCSISDATFASNLHHAHTRDRAEIDPAIAEHLRQPNVLYLAAFRDGSVKVGTSTAARGTKRLLEQGAWRARLVAKTSDGYAVRDIEDRVTEQLGLAQSVQIGRKLDGMIAPQSDDRLEAALAVHASEVESLRHGMGDRRIEAYSEAWSFPGSGRPVWGGLHRYPARLDGGQHDLEVRAACGRMMVVERRGTSDVFVADIGQLYGVQLSLGNYESDELAVQDSLF